MLTKPRPYQALGKLRARQRGVVLLITLIVLVAMTLATIAMVRSVDTTNIIAGNLSFQQAATHSGDLGIETGMRWLQASKFGTTLQANNNTVGYSAVRADPPAGTSWDTFWAQTLNGFKTALTFDSNGIPNPAGSTGGQERDLAGNKVEYVIQRMCVNPGDPLASGTLCSKVPDNIVPTATASSGNSGGSGATILKPGTAVYYRITSRVSGPRNTVSYVQSIVAL
jgi:type IV pilus assembly protein PilX